jgi:hypothetical protein
VSDLSWVGGGPLYSVVPPYVCLSFMGGGLGLRLELRAHRVCVMCACVRVCLCRECEWIPCVVT